MKTLDDIYSAISHPNRRKHPYAIFPQNTLSYGDLVKRIQQLSSLFLRYHCQNGDHVLLCSEDDELITTVTAACLFNGITLVILSPEQTALRRVALAEKARPILMIADEVMRADFDQSSAAFYGIQAEKADKTSALLARFNKSAKTGWKLALAELPRHEPLLNVPLDSLAFINFSSGTTGEPKGICLSFRSILVHMQTLCTQFDYDDSSRILNNMILSHADGLLQGPVLALYCGGVVARPCGMEVQHLEEFLNAVYKLRITHLISVPTVFSFIDRLSSHDDYFDAPDFRHLITVAGMMNTDLWKRLEQRFNRRINNIYGLTETVAGGLFCGPDDATYRRGTVGKPVDLDVRVVDAEGHDVTVGTEGELWLKGDNVFEGYWDTPQKTEEAFEDDWFKTGDLGYLDKDGFVQITGRKKELIISGGFNIHPAEVNEALLKHPSVVDSATIGIEDEQWQEVVVSAVVVESLNHCDEKSLIGFCRQQLEAKKVPKRIVFLDSLPKGSAGKVKIEVLKSLLIQNDSKQPSVLSKQRLFDIAAEVFNVESATLSLTDKSGELAGWDSLGHLTLMLEIEKAAGVQLSATDIMTTESLNDLWLLLSRKSV